MIRLKTIYSVRLDVDGLDLLVHKQPCHSLAGSNAHTGDQNLLLRPPGLTQNRTDLACPRRTQRVTQGDGTSARVDLGMVQPEVVQTVHGHRREGLVDLVDVDVFLVQVELGQELGDRGRGANTHDARRDPSDGGATEFGEDGLVKFDGLGAAHEEHGGGAIGDLTGVASRGPVAELRECRTDLVQRLRRRPVPDTLVAGHSHLLDLAGLGVLDLGGDGHDLLVEPAGPLRSFSATERLRRVEILRLPRNVEVRPDILRSLTHGLHAIRSLLVLQHLVVERLGDAIAASRHELCTHGNTDIDRAQGDLVGDVLHGLQTRGAEAIDRGATGRVRDPSSQGGGADQVGGLAIVDVTKTDVLDEGRVYVGLGQDFSQQRVKQVVQVGIFEAAFHGLGEGRAEGEGDDNIFGVLLGAATGQYRSIPSKLRYVIVSYMLESPEFPPGFRWLRMELKRSAVVMVI